MKEINAIKPTSKVYNDNQVDIFSEIKDYELNNASEFAEDEYERVINNKIAKILGGSVSNLFVIDDESGIRIDENNWNTLLNEKPESIGKTIDLGNGKVNDEDFWYGEGELITTKGGNKIFCWHDSGGFAVKYLIKND